MTFIVFFYEFNFKEVIRNGHKLSVKCCNNEQLHSQFTFYGRLAFVKASTFVEVNQLIAHQTMNVIYDLSTENPACISFISLCQRASGGHAHEECVHVNINGKRGPHVIICPSFYPLYLPLTFLFSTGSSNLSRE